MESLKLDTKVNYVAAFLCFSCQLRCPYCINHHGNNLVKGRRRDWQAWAQALSRVPTREDLPITLQGGEPTTFKGWDMLVNELASIGKKMDLLTNLAIGAREFQQKVKPHVFKREAKYASIRVSYHPFQHDYKQVVKDVHELQKEGYSIGIWSVRHPNPQTKAHLDSVRELALSKGIDFRWKEFLGPWKGFVYGHLRYPNAVNGKTLCNCLCSTTELLIDPNIDIYRCHSDLYASRGKVGSLLDTVYDGSSITKERFCDHYGKCNSCDVKVKTDRFQKFGHSSVTISKIQEVFIPNDEWVDEVQNSYGKAGN